MTFRKGGVVIVWHGTSAQLCELVHAITANCTCGFALAVAGKAPMCTAHTMLTDQRVIDHLAFVKARAEAYQIGEWAK